MSLRAKENQNRDFYRAQVLINSGVVVLSKDKLKQMDDLNSVVLTYASVGKPKPVHAYDVKQHKITNEVVGYRIWCVQAGDPFQVTVAQTQLPQMTFGVTKFQLQNLRGMYSRKWQRHYYKADSLKVVESNEV